MSVTTIRRWNGASWDTLDVASSSPVTPPDSNITTLFGASCAGVQGESRSDAFTRINEAFGGIDIVRYWRSSDASPYTWPLDNSLGGYLPAVISTTGTSPSGVLAGNYDAAYQNMFQNAPTDRPIWWCYWHEPENGIDSGTLTVQQYQQATNYVAQIAAEYAPANMKHCIITMPGHARPNGDWTGHKTDYYLGGLDWDLIDTYAPDLYPWNSEYDATASNSLINLHRAIAASFGKPWALSEYGAPNAWTDAQKAQFLSDSIDIIDADGTCEYVCYYESWRGNRGPWNIVDVSPLAEAVWKAACERND